VNHFLGGILEAGTLPEQELHAITLFGKRVIPQKLHV
jgi:hypothetical protein